MKNGSCTTIMYKKDRGRSKLKLRTNGGKIRINVKKSDVVCMVVLKRNHSLRAAAAWSNDWF